MLQNNRNRLRWTEWLIAILFVVSLLVGSGIFVKASNAANLKSRNYSGLSYSDVNTIPGPIRTVKSDIQSVSAKSLSMQSIGSRDSCEITEDS